VCLHARLYSTIENPNHMKKMQCPQLDENVYNTNQRTVRYWAPLARFSVPLP